MPNRAPSAEPTKPGTQPSSPPNDTRACVGAVVQPLKLQIVSPRIHSGLAPTPSQYVGFHFKRA